MRIAFVLPGIQGGGVRSVSCVARGLIERGHAVCILHRSQRPSIRERARNFYLHARYRRRHDWIRTFPGVVRPYSRLTPERVGRHDVVVGVGVSCVLEIADLPPECGIKVHNCRGMEPWTGEAMDQAWRLPMPRIVVSTHLEHAMRERGSRDAIYVAHNGVDTTDYHPSVPMELRTGVGTVYHGGDVKDPQLVLAVLKQMHVRYPSVPLFVFGGFPRPTGMPSAAHYVRLPRIEKAREWYSRSLVWFVGSTHEGLSNPVLEAIACGCAVVTTACGGHADIIEHGRNGLVVPVGNAGAMTHTIARLLADASLRMNLSTSAQSVLEDFTWPHAVDAMEAALRDIADGSRAAKRTGTGNATTESRVLVRQD